MLNDIVKVFDGGEGSGHFNHVGIPKHKGGSARSGKFKSEQNKQFKEGHIETKGKSRKAKIRKRIKGATTDEVERYSKSLEAYTGVFYDDIKKAYRNKYSGKKVDKGFEKYSNDLDDFIYRSEKYEGTIYRGLSLTEDDASEIIQNLKKGKTMDMQGVSSWSSNRNISISFADTKDKEKEICLLFNVENKSGTSIRELSEFPIEDEVLHPTTSRYILKDKNFKVKTLPSGKRLIEVNLKEV